MTALIAILPALFEGISKGIIALQNGVTTVQQIRVAAQQAGEWTLAQEAEYTAWLAQLTASEAWTTRT